MVDKGIGSDSKIFLLVTFCKSLSEFFSLHLANSFKPGDLAALSFPMSRTTPLAVLIALRHVETSASKVPVRTKVVDCWGKDW